MQDRFSSRLASVEPVEDNRALTIGFLLATTPRSGRFIESLLQSVKLIPVLPGIGTKGRVAVSDIDHRNSTLSAGANRGLNRGERLGGSITSAGRPKSFRCDPCHRVRQNMSVFILTLIAIVNRKDLE